MNGPLAPENSAVTAAGINRQELWYRETVGKAVLAERKRCAAIARSYYGRVLDGGNDLCDEIAEEIERG